MTREEYREFLIEYALAELTNLRTDLEWCYRAELRLGSTEEEANYDIADYRQVYYEGMRTLISSSEGTEKDIEKYRQIIERVNRAEEKWLWDYISQLKWELTNLQEGDE